MKKCPVCGEKFADTYKRCPFCEEDENPRRARQPRRYEEGGGRRLLRRETPEEYDEENYQPRRAAKQENYDYGEEAYTPRRARKSAEYDEEDYGSGDYDYDEEDRGSPWFKIVVVILLAVIVACVLYLGRDVIASLLPEKDPTPPSSMSSGEDVPGTGDDDIALPSGDGVEDGSGEQPGVLPDGNGDEANGDDPVISAPTEKLTLSHADVTIAGGEKFTLTATNGSGSTSYSVKNESIASVSAGGVVTGLKKGWTEVTVRRGEESAVCIVRVRSDAPGSETENSGSATVDTTDARLSSGDFTLRVGESHKLRLSGVTTALSWSSSDSGVATVDGNGNVTAVSVGKATVTVSWDGQSRTCIVRVKA